MEDLAAEEISSQSLRDIEHFTPSFLSTEKSGGRR